MKNRGMHLESLINNAIKKYEQLDICVIHKKEVPVKFWGTKKQGNNIMIDNAKILSKSDVDYYGIYKGRFICFESKSTKDNAFRLSNIKDHQLKYINKIKEHGGLSFYIIGFQNTNEYFLVESKYIKENKGVLKNEFFIKYGKLLKIKLPGYLDFIEVLKSLI